MKDLVILGAGGFARETAAAVDAANAANAVTAGNDGAAPAWRLLGFLDDNPLLAGTRRGGVPILGPLAAVADLPDASVLVCIGNPGDPSVRQRVVAALDLPDRRYATLVHPSAAVGTGVTIGHGTVVLAQVSLTADVRVGAHVAVMPQVVLTHDCVVGDFSTLASGVRLGGGVRLSDGCYLGAGALIRENVTIGAGALVGMGSVVLGDVPAGETWIGCPARVLPRHATEDAKRVKELIP